MAYHEGLSKIIRTLFWCSRTWQKPRHSISLNDSRKVREHIHNALAAIRAHLDRVRHDFNDHSIPFSEAAAVLEYNRELEKAIDWLEGLHRNQSVTKPRGSYTAASGREEYSLEPIPMLTHEQIDAAMRCLERARKVAKQIEQATERLLELQHRDLD